MALALLILPACVAGTGPEASLGFNAGGEDTEPAMPDLEMAAVLDGAASLPGPSDRPVDAGLATQASVSINPEGAAVAAPAFAPEQDAPSNDTLAMLAPAAIAPPILAAPVRASNRERDCLMRAMYFESNRSSPEGLLSVGTVVMNRVAHGAWGPTICGVVGARKQFAPGVLTRRMQGDLSDLQALADKIIAGKRHPKITPKVMFFHVAGMKFSYKNMRYVHVAGGNTFYYKAERKRRR
jgi:spore germination cell wall hydrolase CwlJ-like protein